MDKIKPIFTATATAVGGRNGHSETSDGSVKASPVCAKRDGWVEASLGTTTPEHLFATGYAACSGGALDFIAAQHKKTTANAKDHVCSFNWFA